MNRQLRNISYVLLGVLATVHVIALIFELHTTYFTIRVGLTGLMVAMVWAFKHPELKTYAMYIFVGMIFAFISDLVLLIHDRFNFSVFTYSIGIVLFILGFLKMTDFVRSPLSVILGIGLIGWYMMTNMSIGITDYITNNIIAVISIVFIWQSVGSFIKHRNIGSFQFLISCILIVASLMLEGLVQYGEKNTMFLIMSTFSYWGGLMMILHSATIPKDLWYERIEFGK